jgi:hypothetical protein
VTGELAGSEMALRSRLPQGCEMQQQLLVVSTATKTSDISAL